MNERRKKLEAIFHAASELGSPEERESYLNEACASDADLRREVDALLSAAAAANVLFHPFEEHALAAGALKAIKEQAGSMIGRYKLLEKIGEGGMGVVYMAEQREPVVRKVALKIIKLGMDTRQVVARFEAERQALAMMDHPHIAQVLDGGATDTGRPYFVMELVQGVPITEFCQTNQLSTEQRIQLFIPVCQAIQSAHQKGIIHRDIKPSNVLVTMQNGAPHPMVIDFGVAKAIDQKLTEKTLFTNFATMIGTPAYMSPEQAEMSKLDVDTRSDIYSLGVLLYELLAGSTPFSEERLRGAAYSEMQRIIVEEEPERPSTRLRKKTITKSEIQNPESEIDPDLDWIVMKCLEKDRNRRYETANGLTADITRFLNSEPVVARPPSPAYRLQKFVRRNKTLSTAAAVVTLALTIGIGVSTWALMRERAAREQADRQLRSAMRFWSEIFTNVAPEIRRLPGAAKAREKLGEVGAAMLQELRLDAADDVELRTAVAGVLINLSETQGDMAEGNFVGNYAAGLQRAREAVELLSTGAPEKMTARQLQVLISAKRAVSTSLGGLGRYDEALLNWESTLSLFPLYERFPEYASRARTGRISALGNMGICVASAGRPREALEKYVQPILDSEWAKAITTNSAQWDIEILATTYGQASSFHDLLGEIPAMTEAVEKVMALQATLVRRFPGNVRHIALLAASRAGLGLCWVHSGRTNEAFAELNRSRKEIDALAAKDPANEFLRLWRENITATQARAFAIWSEDPSAPEPQRQQRITQAETYLAESEELHRSAKGQGPHRSLKLARAEVAAAKAKLEGDAGTKPKP